MRKRAAKYSTGKSHDDLNAALRHRQTHLESRTLSFRGIERHRTSRKIEQRLDDVESEAGAFFVPLHCIWRALEFGEHVAFQSVRYADTCVGNVEFEHPPFRALPRVHTDAAGARRVVKGIFHQITYYHVERFRIDGIDRAAKAQFAFKDDTDIFEICRETLTGRKNKLVRLVRGDGAPRMTLVHLHEAQEVLDDLMHALRA